MFIQQLSQFYRLVNLNEIDLPSKLDQIKKVFKQNFSSKPIL